MDMKRRFFLGAAVLAGALLLVSALFLSCSLAEESSGDSTGGVRVALNIALSRTVMPTGFLNATYTLTGTHSGESTVLIENKSASDLQSTVLWLESGSWSFTLDAYVDSTKVATATLANQTISSTSSSLTFTFSGVTFDYASGTGGTNVTLTFAQSAQVAVATAQLYNADGSENSSYTLIDLTPATYSDSLQYVTFSNTNIASGSYLLVFYLYQDTAKTTQIGQWREIVNVASGCESSAVINIPNLNTVYTITYVLNGLSWADGFTAPASFNASQGVTLPVADNFANGTAFTGWYAESDFSGTAVTSWTAGTYTEDVTFYAKVTKSSESVDWSYPTATPALTWTGEGTLNNPYVITTSQQLADFAYMVNNGTTYSGNYITLGADIDLNYGYTVTDASASYSQWKPIGGASKAFEGNFDGDNHTVKGLYINSSCSYAGLFGYVSGSSAIVKNVSVQGYMKVTNGYYVGGVAGYISSATLQNCASNVDIVATMGSGSSYGCGGVVGYNTAGIITRCVNCSSVTASMTASYGLIVGGICGYLNYGSIRNCENYGDVTGTSSAYSCYVGGIVGFVYGYNNSYINNNISSGAIKGKASTTSCTGGILGFFENYSYAKNNAFYGTVDGSGTSIYLHGVGYAYGVSSSYQSCNYFISSSGATASGVGGSVGTFTLASDQIAAYGSTTLDYTGTLLEVLNAWASGSTYSSWEAGSDGWPVISDITWTK